MKIQIAIIMITVTFFGVESDQNEGYRLTHHENTIRLGSCGDWAAESLWNAEILTSENFDKWQRNRSKVSMPTKVPPTTVAPTTVANSSATTVVSTDSSTTEPTTISIPTGGNSSNETSTAAPPSTPLTAAPFETYIAESAVFISQRHVLTSSGFLVTNKNSVWQFKGNDKQVDVSKCGKSRSLVVDVPGLKVIDIKNQVREVRQITLLDFCRLQNQTDHFLTIITVSKARIPIPVICIAKWNTRIDIGDNVDWHSKLEKKTHVKVNKCKDTASSPFLCVSVNSCKPAMMVKREPKDIDFVVGVGTASSDSCDKHQIDHKYHDVKKYIDEICALFQFCGRKKKAVTPSSEMEKGLENIDDDYLDIIPEPEFPEQYKNTQNNERVWMNVWIISVLFLL